MTLRTTTLKEPMDYGLEELMAKISENLALPKDTVVDYLNNALEHAMNNAKEAGLNAKDIRIPTNSYDKFLSITTVARDDSDIPRLQTVHKGLKIFETALEERCAQEGLDFSSYSRLPLPYNLQSLLENQPSKVQYAEIVGASAPAKTANEI